MPNPDLEMGRRGRGRGRGGLRRSPRSLDKWGGGGEAISQKIFFGPSGRFLV